MSASSDDLASALPLLRERASVPVLARDYLALTRPGVLSLVLFTSLPVLAMGREGWPDPALSFAILLGAGLVGAGCSALNAWHERDADGRMARTRARPLPSGRLAPRQALGFGLATSAVGLLVLLGIGGWLPALIGLLTILHYVGVYTVWLKPRSPQNIVIGGAAVAASPLIADAALDGRLGVWSLVLFAIVFLWTPPHFWAIALFRKREYQAAGFPMMPVVVGDRATRRRMLAYALVLIPVTLLPWLGGALGPAYAATALAAGAGFVSAILLAMRAETARHDRRVFFTSIAYLAVVFTAMLAELLLR